MPFIQRFYSEATTSLFMTLRCRICRCSSLSTAPASSVPMAPPMRVPTITAFYVVFLIWWLWRLRMNKNAVRCSPQVWTLTAQVLSATPAALAWALMRAVALIPYPLARLRSWSGLPKQCLGNQGSRFLPLGVWWGPAFRRPSSLMPLS